MKFVVPMKLCPDCYLPTYAVTSSISKDILYYCQNSFCIRFGKSVTEEDEENTS